MNPEGIVLGGELFNPDLSSKADNTSRSSSESELTLKPEDVVLGAELFNPELQQEPNHTSTSSPIKPIPTVQGNIVPARGVILSKNGDVILTAYQTQSRSRSPSNSNNCVNQVN
ncbi:hypothetical protein [Pleurocapsa sp. PCC 7319]|uniref:hypothetical protein n=1 Tax=Pleurocapsa sp. PCC 7319 TaxID=118161 RepID=UPI00034740BC|nr:hypothetical protein [Pleurocapsa sp. PCC 7319]